MNSVYSQTYSSSDSPPPPSSASPLPPEILGLLLEFGGEMIITLSRSPCDLLAAFANVCTFCRRRCTWPLGTSGLVPDLGRVFGLVREEITPLRLASIVERLFALRLRNGHS